MKWSILIIFLTLIIFPFIIINYFQLQKIMILTRTQFSKTSNCKIRHSELNWLLLTFAIILLRTINSEFYGNNQIINGNFEDSYTSDYHSYPLKIKGYTCTKYCEINNCEYLQKFYLPYNYIYANCTGLVLDLNSINQIQAATQIMQLTVGTYLLEFLYYYPLVNAREKTFFVYFNNRLILTVSPQTNRLFKTFSFSQQVIAVDGNNNLTFTMTGPPADGIGFKIGNISLRQVINQNVLSTLNVILNGSVTQSFVSLPASRVLLQQILSWFVCFDRFQFYYYHNRNYSSNALVLLLSVNNLMNQKGSLAYDYLDNVFDPFFTLGNSLITKTNFKLNYTKTQFLNKNQNGFGFFINNGSIFMCALPIGLFLSITSILISKIVSRKYIFKLIAQFTLLGILLNILCEGNIQQCTFYALAQFKIFFCFSFRNKIQSVFLVFFFYVVLFTSVGSLFWFKYHYKDNTRLFIQEYKTRLPGLCICVINKGVICLIFGAIHQLLIDSPNTQLIALITTEIIWLLIKIYFFFCNKVYVDKVLTLLGFVEGVLRITFQVVCYVYSNYDTFKYQINQTVVPFLIYSLIANWLFQLTISITFLLFSVKRKVKHKIMQSKVAPVIQNNDNLAPQNKITGLQQGQAEWMQQIKKGFTLSHAQIQFANFNAQFGLKMKGNKSIKSHKKNNNQTNLTICIKKAYNQH